MQHCAHISSPLQNPHLSLTLATGYFNMTQTYTDLISDVSRADVRLISAAPGANGFHNAAGISGYVPHVYSCAIDAFMKRNAGDDRVRAFEWR